MHQFKASVRKIFLYSYGAQLNIEDLIPIVTYINANRQVNLIKFPISVSEGQALNLIWLFCLSWSGAQHRLYRIGQFVI